MAMPEKGKPHILRGRLPVLLLIAGLILNAVWWGARKEGFHVDEMFSYAQICNPEYCRPMFDPGFLFNWHDASFFEDYRTISSEEAFDLTGAWMTAKRNDAHPPLYFVVFSLVTSLFFQDHFTKWSGLTVNLAFFSLTLAVFYLLCKKLLKSRPAAMAAVAIYGISVGAVNTVVYLRMYMMVTFFSVMLLYVHCLYCEKALVRQEGAGKCMAVCSAMALVLLGGSLTMYYFLVFAFFLCVSTGMTLLISGRWRHAGQYALCTLGSMAVYALVCPSLFHDLLSSHRGKEALSNAAEKGNVLEWIHSYARVLDNELSGSRGGWLLALLALLAVACLLRRRIRCAVATECSGPGAGGRHLLFRGRPARNGGAQGNRRGRGIRGAIPLERLLLPQIFLVCACTLCTVAWVAPYKVDRYVMNLFPGLVLTVLALLLGLTRLLGGARRMRAVVACGLLGLELLGHAHAGVDYLYPGQEESLRRLEPYGGMKAVYASDNLWDVSNLTPYLVRATQVYTSTLPGLSSLASAFDSDRPDDFLLYVGSVHECPQRRLDAVPARIGMAFPGSSLETLFRTVGSQPAGVYLVHMAENGSRAEASRSSKR